MSEDEPSCLDTTLTTKVTAAARFARIYHIERQANKVYIGFDQVLLAGDGISYSNWVVRLVHLVARQQTVLVHHSEETATSFLKEAMILVEDS